MDLISTVTFQKRIWERVLLPEIVFPLLFHACFLGIDLLYAKVAIITRFLSNLNK